MERKVGQETVPMKTEFPKLLEPGKIGPWDMPNRIVMAPMGTLNADKDGFVTDRTLKFYTEQAKGRFGMIVVECTFIDELASKGEENSQTLTKNEQITGYARLASAIKDYGVKAILQLNHMGKQITLMDRPSWGPSTMNEIMGGVMPFPIRGMSKAEIKQCEKDFAKAAWRAKMAGFDGVQIHGSICHLIAMFCSPFYNHRTDEYGGSPENRVRFYKEIIEEVQKECGKDFPIIARLAGSEYSPDGLTLEEGIEQAKILEKTGVVCFHIVGGDYRNVRSMTSAETSSRSQKASRRRASRFRSSWTVASPRPISPKRRSKTACATTSAWGVPPSPIPCGRSSWRQAGPRISYRASAARAVVSAPWRRSMLLSACAVR